MRCIGLAGLFGSLCLGALVWHTFEILATGTQPEASTAVPGPIAWLEEGTGSPFLTAAVAGERVAARDAGPDPEPAEPGHRPIRVRGCCVDDIHGYPLAGVAVDLAVVPPRLGRWIDPGTPAARAPRCFTDGDGTFRAVIEVPPHRAVRLRASLPGRATMQGQLALSGGTEIDFGEIRMPAGARLWVRVIDPRGRPQPHVPLRLYRGGGSPAAPVAPVAWIDVTSDAFGRIECPITPAAGTWRIDPLVAVAQIAPTTLEVDPERIASLQATIVLARCNREQTITGSVQDDRGQPLPDIVVDVLTADAGVVGHGRTDRHGNFEIERPSAQIGSVTLEARPARGFDGLRTVTPYAWGSTGVRLVLGRATDVHVAVVAEDDRAPVEEFGLVWHRADSTGIWTTGGRLPASKNPGGMVTIRAVPAGRIRIVVLPRGRDFAPGVPYGLLKTPGSVALQVALPRRVALPVWVTDAAGRPCTASRVELVRGCAGVDVQSTAFEPGELVLGKPSGRSLLHLDGAWTDDTGRAILRVPRRDGDLAIRVFGPDHVPAVHFPVSVPPNGQPIAIRVRRGATVCGRVAGIEVLIDRMRSPHEHRTWTLRATVELAGGGRQHHAAVDREGAFTVQGLEPGAWTIRLCIWRLGGTGGGVLEHAYPPIQLGEGTNRPLLLDLRELPPSALRDGDMPR